MDDSLQEGTDEKYLVFLACLQPMIAAGPVSSHDRSLDADALNAVWVELRDLKGRLDANWSDKDLKRFYAARETLDSIFRENPETRSWRSGFRPGVERDGWVLYSPAETYHIVGHEPLAIDQAYLFKKSIQLNLQLNPYDKESASNCLAVKALRLLVHGATTSDEDAFLNAVHVSAETDRLSLLDTSFMRAEALNPAFPLSLGEDIDKLAERNAVSGMQGTMLYHAATEGLELDSEEVLSDFWGNVITPEEYPQEWIDRATRELAATEFPERLAKARPFFNLVKTERSAGTEALIGKLCQ